MKYEVTLHQSDHYRKTFKIIASNLDKANEEAQKILDSVDLRTQRETFSESESSFDISELPQEEKPKKRLEYLRKELRAERISYEELAELQSLVEHIDPSDVELLEAAGVEEHESETPLFTALKNSEVALINKLHHMNNNLPTVEIQNKINLSFCLSNNRNKEGDKSVIAVLKSRKMDYTIKGSRIVIYSVPLNDVRFYVTLINS